MLATLRSAAVFGVDAYAVHVEVDVSLGFPSFTMVGLPDTTVLGELSLDGGINAIRGVLPIAVATRQAGVRRILLPPQNALEASIVEGLEVCPARSLAEAIDALNAPDAAPL